LTFADADTEMLAAKRSVRTAGGSAGQRFKTLAKAWRRRALRPVFLACSGLVIGFAIAGTVVTGQAKFWLGALTGGTMALYMALRESPPWHIEKWRAGEEGERRTVQGAASAPRSRVESLARSARKERDQCRHVVLGPAGLFLLDSKNYSGEASIEAGELRVRWLEDPKDGWVCHGMVSRMRAASAEFKERIEAATGVRVWVQPVVVLWMPFPQGVAQLSDVFFVQGELLADWLRKRSPHGRSFDPERISDFLQGKAATTAPAPQESFHSSSARSCSPSREADMRRKSIAAAGERLR
jgi:hypothetical protein